MQIIFILKDQTEKSVDFIEGQTILQAVEEGGVHLHGACEGFGVCGGCHVVIDNLYDRLPEISEQEYDALDRARNVTMTSRLACRIILNKNLEGLRVKLV